MSAYDAVDGAHSAASKCNTELKRRWAIQGGERTAGSGIDGMELKVLTNWRGHDDVMQIRSIRGSGEPAWVIASLNACLRLGPDPRRALRPAAHPPHQQAGHVTAPDQCCRSVRKFLPRRRPHVTHSGHRLLAKLLSTLDSPPACIMECKSFGGGVSPSHFGPRIQIRGNTYWRVSFGWVPNLQRGSPWLRSRPARIDRLIRRARNSSIRFRKCAVTGWRAQRPKSNSALNSRKN